MSEGNYLESQYEMIDKLEITENTRVVYQGVEGAFAEQAAANYFGEHVNRFHVDKFEEILTCLEEGKADYGVLPIENSSAGFVSGTYDLLLNHDVCIVAETIIQIEQSLLAIKEASLSDIDIVYSHPQGLLQSKDFLDQHNWQQIAYANTAMAAKKIKEDGMKNQAAIASKRAAMLYDLEVLEPCINFANTNATRFVILTTKRMYCQDAKKISISFALPHKSGALYSILGHFIHNDLNMTSIESSPLKDSPWEYKFFITFEGNMSDEAVKNAIASIKEEALAFRVLGNY